jgi:hypothetical protein
VINELPYTDETGLEQYLRRTLLAGAQKFDQRFSQTLPQKMLDVFRSYVQYVQRLYIVGYSFGDAHIDLVLRNWLELTEDRKIVIVDPGRKSLPAYFAHLAPQITVRQQTAGQFFADFRSTPLTTAQTSEQEARALRRTEFEQKAAKKW